MLFVVLFQELQLLVEGSKTIWGHRRRSRVRSRRQSRIYAPLKLFQLLFQQFQTVLDTRLWLWRLILRQNSPC